ncbi:serine hydrolase domain-containing protein [Bacillota bacterium]
MQGNTIFADLDEHLKKTLYLFDLPGLAVHAGIDGCDYYSAAGWQNAITKTPLLQHHVFHMASVTKLFVGTAILMLGERGLLNIDEKVIKYLPEFHMADEKYRQITLRHLLTHTSGMADVKNYNWDKPETDDGALMRYVLSPEVTDSLLLWEPGQSRFAYSNMGYEVLGAVIAAVSGQSFEDYVTENIFVPLGMADTDLLTFRRDMSNVCAPHEKDADNHFSLIRDFPYNRAHSPSSTLTSTLSDMALWSKAVLDKKILAPESLEEAFKVHAIVPNNGEGICLSWFRREQNGHVLYGHEGDDDGFRASFWICPELRVSITVCTNMSRAPVKRINREVFDIISRQ